MVRSRAVRPSIAKRRGGLGEVPNPIGQLIRETLSHSPGTEEYRQADAKLQLALKEKGKRLPQDRHEMRMSALYVDLDEDGTTWMRPSNLARDTCYGVICGAVNDYAGQYDPVRIGLIEQDFPPMAAAREAISAQLHLPSPKWPAVLHAVAGPHSTV